METRLDKLFKDQLSKHEEIPSPQAWDRIHGQLVSSRRKLWSRRLAIAASIMLFATVGFFGYRSLNTIVIKNDQFATKSIDENKKNQKLHTQNLEEKVSEKIIPQDINPEVADKTTKLPPVITEVKRVEKNTEAPANDDIQGVQIEEKMPLLSGVNVDKPEIPPEIKIDNQEEINEDSNISEQSAEPLLATNKPQEIQKNTKQKKSYPQVKIIYKADKNSELVTSGQITLVDKGINELTKFSDEHLLTAKRKTMLRNTKDDLLALNFGKLLNKSNKETKN